MKAEILYHRPYSNGTSTVDTELMEYPYIQFQSDDIVVDGAQSGMYSISGYEVDNPDEAGDANLAEMILVEANHMIMCRITNPKVSRTLAQREEAAAKKTKDEDDDIFVLGQPEKGGDTTES